MFNYEGLFVGICSVLIIKAGFMAVRFYDQRAIASKRNGWTFADFVSHLNAQQLYPSETACKIVYEGIGLMRTYDRKFPVHPDDNLRVVYGISWARNYNVEEFVDELMS